MHEFARSMVARMEETEALKRWSCVMSSALGGLWIGRMVAWP
ncbi:hypothetical protein [Actinocrinis puniceicyclus]|nr:hypothetical protein [Actinocrinis puniceicyclus]